MKYIVKFYRRKRSENVEFIYTDRQAFDGFVQNACAIILDEMHKNAMINMFN